MSNESDESKSLTEWCKETEQRIYNSEYIECLENFYQTLYETGYNDEQDYSEEKWDIKEIKFFEIKNDFPRIDSSNISPSILNVNYSIDMNGLDSFEISREELLEFLNAAKS